MGEALEAATNDEAVFARLVARGALLGLPVAFVIITLGVWLGTGQPFSRSLTASILPSVLTGVFGGGFVGTVAAMVRVQSSH